jgi:hypothetical protein
MQGGTVDGALTSAPIRDPAQSGIPGMHRIQDRPVAPGQDHRIFDSKGVATFLVRARRRWMTREGCRQLSSDTERLARANDADRCARFLASPRRRVLTWPDWR